MWISSLRARAQQLLQKFFSTPSPSGPIIDAWHVFSLVRAMWKWMIRPLLWFYFVLPLKLAWWFLEAIDEYAQSDEGRRREKELEEHWSRLRQEEFERTRYHS